MKTLITLLILIQASVISLAQDTRIPVRIDYPGKQFKLIGQLGVEMGDTLSVKGIVVEGAHKGYEDGPNLLVQMIRDSAIQNPVQIPLSPYFGEFGEGNSVQLPKLITGATYSFLVYETGGYAGHPDNATAAWGEIIQTSNFYFSSRLIVVSGKKIDPIAWAPVHFLGRNALLTGTAKNENDTAIIQSTGWRIKLTGSKKWTDAELGKPAEVYGLIQDTKTKGIYKVENGQARLIKLEDQLGKTIKLRGTAWSMNGYWWFNYRGTEMYVEKMEELPGWNVYNHGMEIEITGVLEQEKLPRIDQITLKHDRDLRLYYIVRKASWTPVDLLTPEIRFD